MRITTLNNQILKSDVMDGFRDNVRAAIEHYSGSPAKKESKLFESCALAMGLDNSDRLSSVIKQANTRSMSGLENYQAGLCPFTQVSLYEGIHKWGCSVGIMNGKLNIKSFPRGMSHEEAFLWLSKQPHDTVLINGNPVSENFSLSGEGNEPHWHATIAGYRQDLNDWFSSHSPSKKVTVGYWHTTNKDLSEMCLSEQMKNETHYELILTSSSECQPSTLTLYRMFRIREDWQISIDGTFKVEFNGIKTGGLPPIESPIFQVIVSLLMENAVRGPNRMGIQYDSIAIHRDYWLKKFEREFESLLCIEYLNNISVKSIKIKIKI